MKKNLQHIDEIRFLIIHLILINHSIISYALILAKVDQSLISFWFEFTSPLLGMISGYLFFYGTEAHLGFLKKLKHRFSSLIIPYLVWSLGFFIIYFLLKDLSLKIFPGNYWYDPIKPITLKNAIDSLVHPPLVNFWYLQNLILIIPFNIIFYYLLKNRSISILFFILILFIYAYNPFSLYFSPRFLPCYLMGCYFGYHKIQIPRMSPTFGFLKPRTNLLMSFICLPIIIYISIQTGFFEYNGIFLILMKLAVVLFIIISIYYFLDLFPNGVVFKYLKKYKPYSFFLFAIHTFIFSLVQRPLFRLVGDLLGNKYFTLGFSLFTVIVVLVISLMLGIFIKKKFPLFFGFITGR